MKTVSIIVAIYKVEKYLRQCLDSIIGQTYAAMEIILVDDGSPDRCGEICDGYAETDPRIHVIHKENEGLGMARNSGLSIATGDYVMYVDSDDWLEKDMVEKLVTAMEREAADFAVCGYQKQTDSGKVLAKYPCCNVATVFEEKEIVEKVLLPILGARPDARSDIEREMCVWTNMYRMSLMKENEIRFVSERVYLSEDLFYNIRYLMKVRRAVFIPECLYHYRFNQVSLTNAYRENRFRLLCNLYENEIALLREYDLHEVAMQRVQRTFIMKMRNAIRILVNSDNETKQKRYADLKKILNHETTKTVLREYPIQKYKASLLVPVVFMKMRMTFLVWMEQKLRNRIKKRGQHD